MLLLVIWHANGAYHGVLGAGHVGAEAKLLQARHHVLALALWGPDLQDDYHVACPSPVGAGMIILECSAAERIIAPAAHQCRIPLPVHSRRPYHGFRPMH